MPGTSSAKTRFVLLPEHDELGRNPRDAFPGCCAARSDALLIRGPHRQRVLPSKKISGITVQPRSQKYFHSLSTQITGLFHAVSSLTRGRWPSSRTLGWDAVDADALLTNSADADGEVVWFRRPGAGVKFAMMLRITRMMVTIKPVTKESTKETVKPLRREGRTASAEPVCSCASLSTPCTRDRGCSAHPVFPAPSLEGR
jgi:hypothetical protein